MGIFRKLLKSPIVWISILSFCYFAIRLIHLTQLPIFTDEAIYIRWSQIGGSDASWRFISLTDGKQPLFTWLIMASLRLFRDPLYAGRIVSVVAGYLGMIGMYFLGAEIFHRKKVGLIASCLYILSPFALMYDRLALYDSLVAAFSVWNLYLSVLLVRTLRLDVALILGLVMGAGMLNKTSAFFSLYLLPTTLLLFDWRKKLRYRRLISWTGMAFLSAVLSQTVYSVLRLSPYFYIVAQKDTLFVYPFSEWLRHPFTFFNGNFHGLFDWLVTYLTWPVFLGAIASFLWIKKYLPEKLLLFIWWIAPFSALALFGKVLYPRFVLFMAMPLLILTSYSIKEILALSGRAWIKVCILVIIILPAVFLSRSILFDITHAPIAHGDIGQLINDWPSGWGTPQVVSFLQGQSRKGPVAVYTEGTFGLFPYALEMYSVGNPDIEIHGIWPLPVKIPSDIMQSARKKPTYFVTNQTQVQPDWPLKFIAKYQKGSNPDSAMRLYEVIAADR